jgi:hypothetical protein
MKQAIAINNFGLSIEGLQINNKFFCPKATCDLLDQMHLIEAWSTDSNGEPVILFEKEVDADGAWGTTTGFEFWCHFIKSFFFSQRVAEMVLEHISSTTLYQISLNKIDNLLNAA